MTMAGHTCRLVMALGWLTMSPAWAQTAPQGTGSDASFTPTMRPTRSVIKTPKPIPASGRVKKVSKPAAPHS
jgi:hypothetical protein